MEPGEEFDLPLRSGRVHARSWGPPDAPLTLAVHGLSANLHAFDFLAARLAGAERRIVAIDLRGRGRSEITPPGSYGLAAHARDVLEVADRLGVERYHHLGWSLGALIGITVAASAPHRLRSLTMIDHCGRGDEASYAAVRQGLARLDAVVDRPEDYLAAIRAAGVAAPWTPFWERFYGYELGPAGERFTPTTDRAACTEDFESLDGGHVAHWPSITMPALLLRAGVPLGGGDVVTPADLAGIRAAVPGLRMVEVDRNHFGIIADDHTADAVAEFWKAVSAPVTG
jgi:pimeloyl-ACP methyl ester carboxylesterase